MKIEMHKNKEEQRKNKKRWSYCDWVNMARTDGWRVISMAVYEDDLEGVPVVAGPLGAFYEKLSQLHLMKYRTTQEHG